MGKIIAVAAGGAIGSLGRYTIALLADRLSTTHFPLGTLAANLIGSLLIGLFWGYFDRMPISNEFRLFLFTGFLGGFTTFSTFTRESMQLFKAGELYHALSYILLSNVVGLAMVGAGFYLTQRTLHFE